MKKNNNLFYLAGSLLLALFLFREKEDIKNTMLKITSEDISDALKKIYKKFGKEVAIQVEQVFRWETSHFKSGQFISSRSAGMVAIKNDFPYGWTKFKDLWNTNPKLKPIGLTKPFIVGGKEYKYIIFPDMYSAMLPLALVIDKGGPDAWGGVKGYAETIRTAIPKITNSFT